MKDRVPAAAADDKKKSTDLLIKYDKTKKEWQLGKTKVGGLMQDHKTLHEENNHLIGFLYIFVFAGVYERVPRAAFRERQG